MERGQARRSRLRRNAGYLKAAVREIGFSIPEFPGPIIPLEVTGEGNARRLSRILLDAGIYPSMLRYAGAPDKLFRFVVSSEHTRAQLDQLILALTQFKGAKRSGGGRGIERAR
jgi:7-keto-8-aminopelargonate synthetase-like enzyme